MSNSVGIQPFCFEGNEVRTIIKDDEPWFVAKDICDVLEIKNPSDAIKSLDEDERARKNLGRQGEANIISESGLYTLVIRSNKSQAKPFRRWVTHDVLPSIRKTGSYNLPKRKEVQVKHTHLRGSTSENGLDIRYNLDLAKIVTNPTRQSLEILERLTGIEFRDIDLGENFLDNDGDFQKFCESECILGEDLRISSFILFQAYLSWAKKVENNNPMDIKAFSRVASRFFTKKKSGKIFYLGLCLKE